MPRPSTQGTQWDQHTVDQGGSSRPFTVPLNVLNAPDIKWPVPDIKWPVPDTKLDAAAVNVLERARGGVESGAASA